MRPKRLTFLSQFVLMLACAGGAFFACTRGIPQTVFANDVSFMTSVILAIFVGTALQISWQAWQADTSEASADWGYFAAELCLIVGVIGMALGLAMQGKAIATGGNAIFAAWATQLDATIAGCAAAAVILLMTYNLERGIKR